MNKESDKEFNVGDIVKHVDSNMTGKVVLKYITDEPEYYIVLWNDDWVQNNRRRYSAEYFHRKFEKVGNRRL